MLNSEARVTPRGENIAGLDVNNGRLTAAHFALRGGQLILDRLAAEDYDPELPPDRLATTLRAFWKKNRMPVRTVCASLHSRALIIRYFQYTHLDCEELRQVLRLDAEESLQLTIRQIALDYELTPNRPEDPAKDNVSGVLVAAPRETVSHHLELLRAAGLFPVCIEPSCCAVNNLYTFLTLDQTPDPVCLINLADRTADIIMRSNGNTYPRALFSAGGSWETNTSYLLENIQNALLYHHLKVRQDPVKKILLVGHIPGAPEDFCRRLSDTTALPVETLDLRTRVPTDSATLRSADSLFESCNPATALGLALRRNHHGLQ